MACDFSLTNWPAKRVDSNATNEQFICAASVYTNFLAKYTDCINAGGTCAEIRLCIDLAYHNDYCPEHAKCFARP